MQIEAGTNPFTLFDSWYKEAVEAETSPTELRVGHWVQVKGSLEGRNRFRAAEIEVLEPEDNEVLVGTVTEMRFMPVGLYGFIRISTSQIHLWV